MAWVFIIIGSLFIIFAFVVLTYLYFTNPITKYKWNQRIKNFSEKRERRKARREVNRRFKELKIQDEIREKSNAIKQKEKELQGLSERDLERIQKQGLRYIEEDKR